MTVSIIIAVKACCENLKECVSKCLELEFAGYEIIVLPDLNFDAQDVFSSPKVRIIPTGDVTPPKKRDIGVENAKGDVIAFLDDDAYPAKEWLAVAAEIFDEGDSIGCVCGPAVTPFSDNIRQKASGLVYSSHLVSGNHVFRYIPGKRREVLDFPSCNFFIRKKLFERIGGFNKPFWPGEDTFLCLKVLETKKKMIYDPKVLVSHHRRSLFKGHLRQIKSYALHRGYFAKRYPKNSLKPEYFIPSIFTLGLLAGAVLSLTFSAFASFYFILLAIYVIIIIGSSCFLALKEDKFPLTRIQLSLLVISGIILTHLAYGLFFLRGLFAKKMLEE